MMVSQNLMLSDTHLNAAAHLQMLTANHGQYLYELLMFPYRRTVRSLFIAIDHTRSVDLAFMQSRIVLYRQMTPATIYQRCDLLSFTNGRCRAYAHPKA